MADNADLLALMGDLLRATDRQTEENKRNIDALSETLREEMRRGNEEMRREFVNIFDRFATAVTDGFSRVDKKLDGLNERVDGLNERVDGLNQRVDDLSTQVKETNRRLDVVIEHTGHLTETVNSIDRRLYRIEQDLPNYLDVVRRLTVLETIVLPKAS